MHHILFLIVALTWSTSFMLMKIANPCFGPLGIAGWRCVGGAAILGAMWLHRRDRAQVPRDWKGLLILIFFCYVWPYAMQPIMVRRLDSGFVAIMVSLVPLMTVLAQIPILGKRPSPRQMIGVFGGLVFMVVLMADKIGGKARIQDLLIAATVPLSYAIGNIWNKRRFSKTNPLSLACFSMIGGAAVLLPSSLLTESITLTPQPVFWKAAVALAALGFLGTGIAIGLFYKLIHERGPLYAGMVTYIVPTGAVLLAWLTEECVTGRQLLALAGIIITVAIAQYEPNKEPEEPPSEIAEDA